MSYIRYKQFGNKQYAYEVTAYWDKEAKKPRQRVKYLGVVDEQGNLVTREVSRREERLILDFGDTYLLSEFMKKQELGGLLADVFGDATPKLLSLLCYRLCQDAAMRYAALWQEGNIAHVLYKAVNLSSQRVSELLRVIGNETLQRAFFTRYLPSFSHGTEGIIIDTTALPNQIGLPFNAWGYHDGSIDKQIRFLLVIDRGTALPLFFRYLAGNIVDVASLHTTMEELGHLGVGKSTVILDAGFFSEDNVKDLYESRIDFLTRLPSNRTAYKELIRKEAHTLERFDHVVRYGKRALFVKQKRVTLFGRRIYAHIVLDPERKGRETKRLLLDALEGHDAEIEYTLKKQGIMILVSSFPVDRKEIVPLYYLRQTAETLFGFSKDDLKLIPLRVHTEETLRGYLFLIFLALTVFLRLRKEIGDTYTVDEALLIMRNLKCKVFEQEILVQELTKRQREIVERLGIIVPKKMGI